MDDLLVCPEDCGKKEGCFKGRSLPSNKSTCYTPLEYSQDSIGRSWIICPYCGRKTPAWSTGGGWWKTSKGRAIMGWCRWCKKKWGGRTKNNGV